MMGAPQYMGAPQIMGAPQFMGAPQAPVTYSAARAPITSYQQPAVSYIQAPQVIQTPSYTPPPVIQQAAPVEVVEPAVETVQAAPMTIQAPPVSYIQAAPQMTYAAPPQITYGEPTVTYAAPPQITYGEPTVIQQPSYVPPPQPAPVTYSYIQQAAPVEVVQP